jgi:hypothetical protein
MLVYVPDWVPKGVQRCLLKWFPNANVQKMREISEAMERNSRHIYNTKKAALEKGDEAVIQQVGEGKDIMSILSE